MKKLFLLIVFFVTASVFAQVKVTLNEIKKEYESFEYEKVIILSSQILEGKDTLAPGVLIDIYLMKAQSHYALTEENNAKNCFFEILRINRNYVLDEEYFSPKIVAFFNNVKRDFLLLIPEKPKQEEKKLDTEKKEEQPKTIISNELIPSVNEYKIALVKSILLPGLGHFAANSDTKGWLFTAASVLSYGSMIYFIVNTNSKEKDYLNETNAGEIKSKYDTYNTSYKIRNTLIASSIIIWAYSQLDFLFWDVNKFSKVNFSVGQNSSLKSDFYIGLSAKISF